jgi:hypothetical protein
MIFTGLTLTLLEMVQCDLARGDMACIDILDQMNKEARQENPNPVQQVKHYLRQETARGNIVRIYPCEYYIAREHVEFWCKGGSVVRIDGRLFDINLSDSPVRKSRSELGRLFRNRQRIFVSIE